MNIISEVQCAKYTDLLVALSLVRAATIPEQTQTHIMSLEWLQEPQCKLLEMN